MGLRIAAESCRGNQKTWVPTDPSPWAEGPRNKSGHGGPNFVQSSAALSFGGSEKWTRAGMDEIGLLRVHYLIASEHQLPSRCSSNPICYRLVAERRTGEGLARWAGGTVNRRRFGDRPSRGGAVHRRGCPRRCPGSRFGQGR